MDRTIHYESAFRDYLQAKGWPYVAVDESHKAIFSGVAIKSFDFLVYSGSGPNLLIDVKGHEFHDGVVGGRCDLLKVYENRVTRDDVDGLREWQKVFGPDFMPVLVFAYWLQGPPERSPFADVHFFHRKHYAFVGVGLEDYVAAGKPRSEKWRTLTVPSARFARQVRDIAEFL